MAIRPAEPQTHRFTVQQYYQMGAAGIFDEDARVELIEGEIIEMVPVGAAHAAIVDRLTHLFASKVKERAIVRVQNPVRLSDLSEPQPDIALLEFKSDYYSEAHPGPGDILLVIEVADTSLKYDRGRKIPLYAQMGIREVWLIDVSGRSVEVFRAPAGSSYTDIATLPAGEQAAPQALPDIQIGIEEIVP